MNHWRQWALRRAACPVCHRSRWFARLGDHETLVRCLGCRASVVTLSLVAALERECPDLLDGDVYELSARGSLFECLQKRAGRLTGSEYLPGVPSGVLVEGIRSEDVQALSFADATFNLVTSTEVFEHVPDDHAGFLEVRRVLRPNGAFLFTVPLLTGSTTVERARQRGDGSIEHLLEPEYHRDPARGGEPVLAYRTYGVDITDRLLNAGFRQAAILAPDAALPWDAGRPVVLARS